MEQFSKEQAQAILNSRIWENWTDQQIVRFQLLQNNPIMPFSKFHLTLERYLGRPVWSVELDFQKDKLVRNIFKTTSVPTENEIRSLIPAAILNVGYTIHAN